MVFHILYPGATDTSLSLSIIPSTTDLSRQTGAKWMLIISIANLSCLSMSPQYNYQTERHNRGILRSLLVWFFSVS